MVSFDLSSRQIVTSVQASNPYMIPVTIEYELYYTLQPSASITSLTFQVIEHDCRWQT